MTTICSRCQLPTDPADMVGGRCATCLVEDGIRVTIPYREGAGSELPFVALGAPAPLAVEGVEAFDDAPTAPPDSSASWVDVLPSILTPGPVTSWGIGDSITSLDVTQ